MGFWYKGRINNNFTNYENGPNEWQIIVRSVDLHIYHMNVNS